MDACYFKDDYPRAGCVAAIDVMSDGYGLAIQAQGGQVIERYYKATTIDQVTAMPPGAGCEGRRD